MGMMVACCCHSFQFLYHAAKAGEVGFQDGPRWHCRLMPVLGMGNVVVLWGHLGCPGGLRVLYWALLLLFLILVYVGNVRAPVCTTLVSVVVLVVWVECLSVCGVCVCTVVLCFLCVLCVVEIITLAS